MFEIKGKMNTAICYAKVVENEAIEQIRRMCDYGCTAGSKIRIMPDVHAGKGCTIGTRLFRLLKNRDDRKKFNLHSRSWLVKQERTAPMYLKISAGWKESIWTTIFTILRSARLLRGRTGRLWRKYSWIEWE